MPIVAPAQPRHACVHVECARCPPANLAARAACQIRFNTPIAGLPVAIPLFYRIGRAHLETASTRWALAKCLHHRSIAFHRHRTQHGGEQHARPELRRQQLKIEPKRAKSCLDGGMREWHERFKVRLGIVVIAGGCDMGRWDDERRVTAFLQPIHQLQ